MKTAEQNYDNLVEHLDRLKEHSINERLLVCEGDSYFMQDPSCYRWLPYNVYKSGSLFVYKTKVAIQFGTVKQRLLLIIRILQNQNRSVLIIYGAFPAFLTLACNYYKINTTLGLILLIFNNCNFIIIYNQVMLCYKLMI